MDTRIFVIEDDESIREIIKLSLTSSGYQVITFDNAIDALKEIDKNINKLLVENESEDNK